MATTTRARTRQLFIERFGVFAYRQLLRGRAKTDAAFYRFFESHPEAATTTARRVELVACTIEQRDRDQSRQLKVAA
jgi:hypothetical protein